MFDQPLLQTKVSTPQIPNQFVHRPCLTEWVKQGAHGPLTLLTAPAGFGKTHLLMEWAKEADLPVAWFTIDRQDNDLNRFFCYFIGALQTLAPQLGAEALEFIQFNGDNHLEVGLTLLINELSVLPQDIALVLDDFQAIDHPLVLQGLSFLLKYLPPHLHLLIASRSEPDLDLAWLRAKGRVVELDASDLRFRDEEVGQYFQQTMGWQLSPEAVQAVEERSDGWVTSLQMLALSLQHQTDPTSLLAHLPEKVYYVSDFLAEEVLDRQPEEVRQFLLRSSILETLSGPLCEAVVAPDAQPGYGVGMLNRLEHARLFITALDEQHEWFRYHPLFADFLRQALASCQAGEVSDLHKRAAIWLEANGQLDEAFRQAFASRDMEWAADLIERNHQAILKTGEISSLTYWIGKLPEEVTRRRPYLILTYAWALIATHRIDLAQYWLEEIQQLIDRLEKQKGGSPSLAKEQTFAGFGIADLRYFRGSFAVSQTILAMLKGDMEQAAKFSRQATSDLPEENVYLRSLLALDESLSFVLSGDPQKAIESLHRTMRIARQANNPFVMIIAASSLADMETLQGQLSKAWETFQKAQFLAIGPESKPHPLTGFVDVGLGEILLERDFLAEAREYLERGCQAIQSMWYLGSLGGLVSLARLRQAQGDISGAQAAMEEAMRNALSTESSQWDSAYIAAVAVRLALQRNDLVAAEGWWRKGECPDLSATIAIERYPYSIYEYLLLTQARFLLAQGRETGQMGDLQRASDLLETLLPEAERLGRVSSQIEILILLAMVQSALGNEGAKESLLHALALGEPEGYRRIYLDEGERLSELLRQCRVEQKRSGSYLPSLAFIDSLLDVIQPTSKAQEQDQRPIKSWVGPTRAQLEDGLPIALSAREMEVLGLIAAGKSNQEISSELYLALNTVKRHAYNIYAKLEVQKRTHAVSKARQLGLI